MGLQNLGAQISDNADLVYEDYIDVVKAGDLTSTQVDDRINAGLTSYANKSYVDSQDALNATQTYVDAGDAARVRTSTKDVPNGVPGLDAGGRVSGNRINLPTNQKYNAGPWSPPTYPGVTTVTTETTLLTCPVTDPGFPYKLVVYGQIDAKVSLATEYPIISIRQGSSVGPVVAYGAGVASVYQALGIDLFERTTTYVQGLGGTDWSQNAAPAYSDATDGIISCDGHDAYWNITTVGQASKLILARRVNPVDALTATDYQLIWGTLGSIGAEPGFGAPTGQTTVYGRVNAGGTQYVRAAVSVPGSGDNQIFLYYSTGAGDIGWLSFFYGQIFAGDSLGLECGTPDGLNPYRYTIYKRQTDGQIATLTVQDDPSHNTQVGPSNRGWGFGLFAQGRGPGLTPRRPQSMSEVKLDPAVVTAPASPVRILPTDLGSQSVLTGSTTLYIRAARSGSSATVTATNFMPKIHVQVVPA